MIPNTINSCRHIKCNPHNQTKISMNWVSSGRVQGMQCIPVQCGGLKTVMMSTAIDPHLTVLCISKAGQHLRSAVQGADLSARPGLKLPSGNPSNSSYVHSHIWKGGRTRGPQGFACDVGQKEQDCAPFYQGKLFKESPSRHTLCSVKYHREHVRGWISPFTYTYMTFFCVGYCITGFLCSSD